MQNYKPNEINILGVFFRTDKELLNNQYLCLGQHVWHDITELLVEWTVNHRAARIISKGMTQPFLALITDVLLD